MELDTIQIIAQTLEKFLGRLISLVDTFIVVGYLYSSYVKTKLLKEATKENNEG